MTIEAGNTDEVRLPTTGELSIVIKCLRELRHWSQEQLAEISGLSVRTVQRIEQGAPSSLDTRRAIAGAFDFDDIDLFNKPTTIPSRETVEAEQKKFEREYITLAATPLVSGKQLARLAETSAMDMAHAAFELTRPADETFAAFVDYFRDYRDCADMYAETQKFDIYDDLQSHIDELRRHGVALCYATRRVQLRMTAQSDDAPIPTTILYIVAFPLGQEPDRFATPRSINPGL